MSKRSRLSIGQAVMRLTKETLVPLCDLKELAGVSELTLRRWAIQGRAGRYLDALHRPSVGWMSSSFAVLRFMAEVRLIEASEPTKSEGADPTPTPSRPLLS